MLKEHRGAAELPDVQITGRILENFETMAQVSEWLEDMTSRVTVANLRGWGYYPKDAEEFMHKRKQAAVEEARKREEHLKELRRTQFDRVQIERC